MDETFLTTEEVAKVLRVSMQTVQNRLLLAKYKAQKQANSGAECFHSPLGDAWVTE